MSEKEEIMSSNSFTDEEQRYAVDAHQSYLQGHYDSCISTLKKVQKNHPGDCKLMHNRALAEFHKSGQTKTAELKKNLMKVHKVTQQSHQEEEESVDDTTSSEYSILHFNQSVLYFNLHQYAEAQSLLEVLVEAADSTSTHINEIYLLLAEIDLINHEPEKAGKIVTKLDEIISKPASPQSQHSKNAGESKEKGKQKVCQNSHAAIKNALPLLKTRCILQMKSMKACKRELKAFASLEGTPEFSSTAINIISVFLKSNFEFQRGNYFKAYKLLGSSLPTSAMNNTIMNMGECLLTMFYNNLGIIHFHVAKYNLGTFYLTKAVEENDKAINPVSRKAEGKQQAQSVSSNVKTLQMLNMNKKFELLYNSGIQLLFAGKPSAAFDCLIVSAQVFFTNPRLWLRLAECCIHVATFENGSGDSNKDSYTKQSGQVPYTVVGSGIHQKLILHPITNQCNGSASSVMPGATLEFASVCLQNALTLLKQAGVGASDGKEKRKQAAKSDVSDKKVEISVGCFPSPPVSGQDLNNLYASVLSNSAYVALALGNNLIAYEYSKMLLQLPNISGRQRYLARMYSAESLVCLDRIADAIQQLSNEGVTDIGDSCGDSSKNSSISENSSSQTQPKPPHAWSSRQTQVCFKSLSHAQGCMLLNLATAHCLRSEFEKAQKLLTQFASLVPPQDVPPNAILLAVYIQLHTAGGLPVALKILQRNALLPHTTFEAAASKLQVPAGIPGMSATKQFAAVAAGNQPYQGFDHSSNGSISGSSSGSRSKSSTPQLPYSGPPSGSVTPERMVKSAQPAKVDATSKMKRRR